MLKNRILIKVSLIIITTSIFFAGCNSNQNKVGFKGIYVKDNINNACSVIKKLANENQAKYYDSTAGCKAEMGGFNVLSALSDHKNHLTYLMISGSKWCNVFFNKKHLSNKKFTQTLIKNTDWLDDLKILPQKYAIPSYVYDDVKKGYSIIVMDEGIVLKAK